MSGSRWPRVYSDLRPGNPFPLVVRTSLFTAASTRILAAVLLLGSLPCVSADCWIDSYVVMTHPCSSSRLSHAPPPPSFLPLSYHTRDGNEVCDGLSPAARAGIGIAFCESPSYSPHLLIAYRPWPANINHGCKTLSLQSSCSWL